MKTGHIADHDAVVRRRLGLHLHPMIGAMRATPLVLKTANRQMMSPSKGGPGIGNQQFVSGCEGWAHGYGITGQLNIDGTPIPLIDPMGLYLGALLVDRGPAVGDKLDDLLDQGTMPSSIQTALHAWGSTDTASWGRWPITPANVYKTPPGDDLVLIEPAPEQLYAESLHKVNGAYFIQSSARQKLVDLMTVLSSKKLVTDAIPASGAAFQSYAGGILTSAACTGPIDHANLIVDYEWLGTADQLAAFVAGQDDSLARLFKGWGQNSWGEVWGMSDVSDLAGGFYNFDSTFVDRAEDLCVLNVTRASAPSAQA